MDKVEVSVVLERAIPGEIVVLMDTTYFGREFGVMLFKDAATGGNLYKQYVKYETNRQYANSIANLTRAGV